MPSWSTDVRHLVPADDQSAPAAARKRASYTRALVEAATSQLGAPEWQTAVRCIARLGRKTCGAPISVKYNGVDSISWSCAACGENGVIQGFIGGPHDLSVYVDMGEEVTWGFGSDEQTVLLSATESLPELRGIITRAQPHAEVAGLLIVRTTVEELDDIYSLVEALEDATRSRKRLELLEGLRFSLSTAMDGF